jgi:hypothetical protein
MGLAPVVLAVPNPTEVQDDFDGNAPGIWAPWYRNRIMWKVESTEVPVDLQWARPERLEQAR